jgi:hypothetical protein
VLQIAGRYDGKPAKRSRFEIGAICGRLIPSLRASAVFSLSGACMRQKTPNPAHFAFAYAEIIRPML